MNTLVDMFYHLTTHSPAVIMNGWLDNVTEVSEITEDE